MRGILLASVMLLVAGCGVGPLYEASAPVENVDRVLGLPWAAALPLAPVAGDAWPAAPERSPTMLDYLAEEKTPRPVSHGPAGGAASRGDYGLCRPGAAGTVLGVC